MPVVAVAVVLVISAISALHVYWGVMGVSGRSRALPEVDGQPVFLPSRLASFSVAFALAIAAALVLARGGILSSLFPPTLARYGTVAVAVVFLVRAVGDFRLVGLFKRVRGTSFATWDTRLYSPLCLTLGLATLWVAAS